MACFLFHWRPIGDSVALPDQSNNTEHTSTLRVQNNYPAWEQPTHNAHSHVCVKVCVLPLNSLEASRAALVDTTADGRQPGLGRHGIHGLQCRFHGQSNSLEAALADAAAADAKGESQPSEVVQASTGSASERQSGIRTRSHVSHERAHIPLLSLPGTYAESLQAWLCGKNT